MPEWPIGTALKAVVDRNANRGFESRPLCLKTYRLDRRFALQLFGHRMIAAAVMVLLGFVGVGVGGFLKPVGIVLFVLAVGAILWGVLVLVRPPRVIRLSAHGYRIGRVPEGGVVSDEWIRVEKVKVESLAAGLCLVLVLTDGRVTTVPLSLVAQRSGELQREVHERLNTA
ncbi:MAG: hypothetical protein JWP10_517, partial [Nocardioidaceae bacterium]|nr:hypothetical protein [Nocardioidaceae bacterium]